MSGLWSPHKWWESSGTTHTCEHCNLVAFAQDSKGRPVSWDRRELVVFGKMGEKQVKEQPSCQATH